jgi:hypothetical protein
MLFARGDVRVHILSQKNDHGPSYRRYRALQRSRRLRINSREIFGVVRFSTFATVSDPKRTSPLENCSELVARAADLGLVKLNYQSGI